MRSIDECIASVMIATDPVIAPAVSFSAMSSEFDAIYSAAARVLAVPPAGLAAISGPANVSRLVPAAPAGRAPRGRGG
jgi:hypothetical protein